MTSPKKSGNFDSPEPGDLVRTPTGRAAVVLESTAPGEFLIQWVDGDRAEMRACHLRVVRKAD